MIGYIYQIINNQTKERYVGQTINLTRRLSEHKRKLNNNEHPNKKLQNAWNKYGKDCFTFDFEEFELKDNDELNQLEINTIKKFDSYYNGYNLTIGGDGGNTRGKLSFEDYCFIYIGCQWTEMTAKIAKYLNIDSSIVSAILREKSYLWYKDQADNLSNEEKEKIISKFREVFSIPKNKPYDKEKVRNSLTEDDYFYCLCIASSYGRGIEAALAKYFSKHKSFLSNGIKNKTKGKAYQALQRFQHLSDEEVISIGEQKFQEWEIQNYSSNIIKPAYNDKWR